MYKKTDKFDFLIRKISGSEVFNLIHSFKQHVMLYLIRILGRSCIIIMQTVIR